MEKQDNESRLRIFHIVGLLSGLTTFAVFITIFIMNIMADWSPMPLYIGFSIACFALIIGILQIIKKPKMLHSILLIVLNIILFIISFIFVYYTHGYPAG